MNNISVSAYAPKCIAYLEKYRIFEIFNELITKIIIASPENPLLFIKSQLISLLQSGSNKIKIILLAPGMTIIDKKQIARGIAEQLGIVLLSRADIIESYTEMFGDTILDVDVLAHTVGEKLKTYPFKLNGWIMIDHPQTMQEAHSLQKNAILPTCTIYLKNYDPAVSFSFSNNYPQRIFELKNIFKATLKEVDMKDQTLDEIVVACCKAVVHSCFSGLPIVYRVVLLGPPGCEVHHQAVKIAAQFKLVIVDFEYLLCQSIFNDAELGRRIRNKAIDLNDIKNILCKKLNEKDCLENGWILINFPKNVNELKILYSFETPPNRVVFFNISQPSSNALILSGKLGEISQYAQILETEMIERTNEYFINIEALKLFCGKTAIYIDASKTTEIIEMTIQEGILQPH